MKGLPRTRKITKQVQASSCVLGPLYTKSGPFSVLSVTAAAVFSQHKHASKTSGVAQPRDRSTRAFARSATRLFLYSALWLKRSTIDQLRDLLPGCREILYFLIALLCTRVLYHPAPKWGILRRDRRKRVNCSPSSRAGVSHVWSAQDPFLAV